MGLLFTFLMFEFEGQYHATAIYLIYSKFKSCWISNSKKSSNDHKPNLLSLVETIMKKNQCNMERVQDMTISFNRSTRSANCKVAIPELAQLHN